VHGVGHRNLKKSADAVRRDWCFGVTWRQVRQLPIVFAVAGFTIPVAAAVPSTPEPTVAEVESSAPASAWRPVNPENLILVDTAKGTLAIELAPGFAPAHVAAIRRLVHDGAFTGGAVVRVQDNYVVQFAAKSVVATANAPGVAATAPALPAEYEQPRAQVPFTPLPYPDAYAAQAGFSDGWPVARDADAAWLVHCYGVVGAGRDLPPSTGDGSELYAVIGHAPRHLDRNMAVVGRVIHGIEPFAALPRGTEALGFYKTEAEKLPITSARLASDLPSAQRPRYEVMRTDTPNFAALIAARANRREPFFLRPAGGVDVCNVHIPVRLTAIR
jgi:peptidylprolyl isomerase